MDHRAHAAHGRGRRSGAWPSRSAVPGTLGAVLVATCLACTVMVRPLPAMEALTGVVAVVDPDRSGSGNDALCGGSAVVVSPAGLALTLRDVVGTGHDHVEIVLPGGRRTPADVISRGSRTGAVLLHIDPTILADAGVVPVPMANSDALLVGQRVWTIGNSFGVLEQDGVAALSRGVVSGRYAISADTPAAHGRGGRILTRYRGEIIETDAAVNDGNQGGALVDDAGRLVGLVSLGMARERRLGTAIPIRLVAEDLSLPMTGSAPAVDPGSTSTALATMADRLARSVVLIYCDRPHGLGNPKAVPRPPPIDDQVPLYQRKDLENAWDQYYHALQIFYTDQPITALVIDAHAGLILTAASNLHGGVHQGRVLFRGGTGIPCTLVGTDAILDLAVFKADRPLPAMDAPLGGAMDLAAGDPVAIIGRHDEHARHTLTIGMVSALRHHRDQGEDTFDQTDARADYGNLGGPVIDLTGRVVGMITCLGPSAHWPWLINSGVALFTDSAAIAKALPDLEHGRAYHGHRWIGLGLSFAADSMVVHAIVPGTGAALAGLQPGDRIVAIGGVPVRNPESISRVILHHHAGDTIGIVVVRAGAELHKEIRLGEF